MDYTNNETTIKKPRRKKNYSYCSDKNDLKKSKNKSITQEEITIAIEKFLNDGNKIDISDKCHVPIRNRISATYGGSRKGNGLKSKSFNDGWEDVGTDALTNL